MASNDVTIESRPNFQGLMWGKHYFMWEWTFVTHFVQSLELSFILLQESRQCQQFCSKHCLCSIPCSKKLNTANKFVQSTSVLNVLVAGMPDVCGWVVCGCSGVAVWVGWFKVCLSVYSCWCSLCGWRRTPISNSLSNCSIT